MHMRRVIRALAMFACALPEIASPWTVSIAPAQTRLYLQVGAGAFNGLFIQGGTPLSSPIENIVSVNVTPANMGTGALPMTSDSTTTTSFYDGTVVCQGAGPKVYIGGYYQASLQAVTTPATLTVWAPASLVSAQSRTISFSTISWTTSIDNRVGDVQTSGRFVGGTSQPLASIAKNTWFEDCYSFTYDNTDGLLRAGTYTGQVTYTLTSP